MDVGTDPLIWQSLWTCCETGIPRFFFGGLLLVASLFFLASFRGPNSGVHVGETDGHENRRDKPVWAPGALGGCAGETQGSGSGWLASRARMAASSVGRCGGDGLKRCISTLSERHSHMQVMPRANVSEISRQR